MLVKIRKKDLTLSCSLDEAWRITGFKLPHVHTHKPTLTELHRRLRQVVNYTESSLRVDRMYVTVSFNKTFVSHYR